MKNIIKTSLIAATALFFASGCASSNHENMEHPTHKSTAHAHEAHWDYKGKYSPEHWGEMKEEYKLCSTGKMQTPINIDPTEDINITPLEFSYITDATDVINNGHTVQVNIANGSSVIIDGRTYNLKQFHFHTPSENNIKGKEFALEAHFVHATDHGELAVVAVVFQEGEANPVIDKIWEKFPLKLNEKTPLELSTNEIKAIMPKNKDYYKFIGSLTTPPCSENVKWNVFKTSMTISKDQVKQFFDVFGHSNNRPLQDTNGRKISE